MSSTGAQAAVLLVLVMLAIATEAVVAGSPEDPGAAAWAEIQRDFGDPPLRCKPRPLWFWNGPLSEGRTHEMMERSRESGYGGFGILPAPNMTPEFMTPEFLDRYQEAVDNAAALGQKMCLYDEYWFPSGAAGGQLARRFPEALSKRLDMLEVEVTGPQRFEQKVPEGRLMGAVAMHGQTKRRIDLTASVAGGVLAWDVPPGPWKVMIFNCVTDGGRDLVDYLDPDAVGRFIELTYDRYYLKFPEHFGKTIDSAFFDEPTFHWVEGGRAWTPKFNAAFETKYGRSPVVYYPALWHDVGPETAAARNALFGFRAELYANGFVKTVNAWCRRHGIALTGHQDQEEVVNPVGLCGDLIKSFQYQDIPGIDQIFQYGRASKAYKVVSSAAYNYDRPLVMTECYGGIKEMPVENLYKEAMDQFAKGINLMVPHAVWYDSAKIVFPPELSYESPIYGPELPSYNRYVGRLQRLLQQGRHVADVGVLYPIATLQAGYRFGVGKPYEGGVIPPEADYMDVGEMLALRVRRDYTFLHPEVLDARCAVDGPTLRLENETNHEQYRVFLIPGSRAIHLSNLEKIKQFYDQGGRVIATTRLPDASAEFHKNAEVQSIVASMFGTENLGAAASPRVTAGSSGAAGDYVVRANANGGKAYFASRPTPAVLKAILDDALGVYDVEFEDDLEVSEGNLSYIHKVIGGREVYFFANSSEVSVDTHVRLRGKLRLERWDPHTGDIRPWPSTHLVEAGTDVTRAKLTLPPVASLFLVAARPTGDE
ncbi:MAG TPA: glycosyl hydrolase [Thermoguttaceae bacterium]|nr:glycosyl hydrolase [Thermoguttaceae bacterium]